jgi:hypothetical protein
MLKGRIVERWEREDNKGEGREEQKKYKRAAIVGERGRK